MPKQHHAIVIGGSMAGMCAARILADHFERVTVVDRDHYPEGAFERAGVPQSRHVHVLLARGRLELENLFPGFEQTVLSRGALDTDFGWDFARFARQRMGAARDARHQAVARQPGPPRGGGSRTAAQARATSALSKESRVTGLIANENRSRVLGVKTISSDDRETIGELRADFIVDASGRSSKAPNWLHGARTSRSGGNRRR